MTVSEIKVSALNYTENILHDALTNGFAKSNTLDKLNKN